MNHRYLSTLLVICAVRAASSSPAATNYLWGIPPINADGTLNAVIEIPAGTRAKFELNKEGTAFLQDVQDGQPRVVDYCGYLGNYGIIPRTCMDQAQGGDGDPLDVLVLGDPVPRGTVLAVRLVAMLRLWERGAADHKLIAVLPASSYGKVTNNASLAASYPGLPTIIETWFLNYKGRDRYDSQGFADVPAAWAVLTNALRAAPCAQIRRPATPQSQDADKD